MTYLLICTILLAANIFNFSVSEVLDATETILTEKQIPIKEVIEEELITETIDIDVNVLNKYISENQPDDNSGWTKGRFYLKVKICEINKKQTKIIVNAYFERFGVPSVMLLIPPAWTPVSSNGNFEKDIIEAIDQTLRRAR